MFRALSSRANNRINLKLALRVGLSWKICGFGSSPKVFMAWTELLDFFEHADPIY